MCTNVFWRFSTNNVECVRVRVHEIYFTSHSYCTLMTSSAKYDIFPYMYICMYVCVHVFMNLLTLLAAHINCCGWWHVAISACGMYASSVT